MTIPAKLHFCWIGPCLPWAYAFGILSAVEHSALPDIILHHTDTLNDDDALRLVRSSGVRLDHIEPRSYLLQVGQALGLGDGLSSLYAELTLNVMRADVLRAAILHTEGGVYLDLDTLTVAPLLPLLDAQSFLSSELIVWPRHVRQSRSPLLWARHLTLDVIRKLCRQAPQGWKIFRRLQNLYVQHVNNAIMGTTKGSAFFSKYLSDMIDVPTHRLSSRYALGPTLLQDVAERHTGGSLHVHKPVVFSPLPPEISEHWFRNTGSPDLRAVLLPETKIVHWYASVRTKHLTSLITPAYIIENRHRQLYSALVYFCIGDSAAFRSLVGLSTHA